MDLLQQTTNNALPREAFFSLTGEISVFPEDKTRWINVDVPAAIAIAMSAQKRIANLREEIATLPKFNMAQFDKLPTYILAASYSHTLYVLATTPPAVLPTLEAEGNAQFDILMSNAVLLGKQGIVDTSPLQGIKTPNSYRTLAVGLTAIISFARSNWSKFEGKTALTMQDLDKGDVLALRILEAIGDKETLPATAAEATLTRQRAFMLFYNAYAQARRAVAYLRFDEGDAEEIAPSLYLSNARGKGAAERANPSEPVTPPSTNPATPTIPAVPVGHQGGSPLVS
jgi:hypothetical protein